MIVHQVEQGSIDWFKVRMGKPTASSFHEIISPRRQKLSGGRWKYACRLVAERLMNWQAMSLDTLEHVRNGKSREPAAAAQLELIHEMVTEPVGFLTTDSLRIGASPDRLVVGAGWPVELKAPTEPVMMSYLLADEIAEFRLRDKLAEREDRERDRAEKAAAAEAEGKKLRKPAPLKEIDPDDFVVDTEFVYLCKRQGQIWVAEADKAIFYAYHPAMPECFIETARNGAFIDKLANAVDQFCDEVDALEDKAKTLGVYQAYQLMTPETAAYDRNLRNAPLESENDLADLIEGATGDRLDWGAD